MSNSSSPGQLSRQELYDKIRESSKDEYILAEMKRLGFWKEGDKPSESEALIERRGELQRNLQDLLKKQRLYSDPEAALKALRKERMDAALKKREETRKKKADERYQKSLAWHEKQVSEITWLGAGVSLGLQHNQSQDTLLEERSLPSFSSHKALAEAMNISLNELRFLSYQRQTSKINHYQRFQIAKKSGGFRHISAPMPRLKRAQYWILDNILYAVPLHDAAHGFVPGRSIITNAETHVGKEIVINLDLQNFFPTINYRRIKGLFNKMGYSESLSTVLSLLCSEPDVQALELDNEEWFVQQGERHLPQGAPTSPMISNLITRAMDVRLQGLAKKHGFTYTRYADDLTFSGNKEARENSQKLLWGVKNIVTDEGFIIHPDKTRIMRKGQQQEVTGLVVNDRLSIDRKTLKRFRALLNQIEKSGLEGRTWNGVSEPKHLLRSILGYANFVSMVLPEKGQKFRQQSKAIYKQYAPNDNSWKTAFQGVRKSEFRRLSSLGQAPLENWKQAKEKAAPIREKTAHEIQEERKLERANEKHEVQINNQLNASSDNTSDTESLHLGQYQKIKNLTQELSINAEEVINLSSLKIFFMKFINKKALEKTLLPMIKAEVLTETTEVSLENYDDIDSDKVKENARQFSNTYLLVLKLKRNKHALKTILAILAPVLSFFLFKPLILLTPIFILYGVSHFKDFRETKSEVKRVTSWYQRIIEKL